MNFRTKSRCIAWITARFSSIRETAASLIASEQEDVHLQTSSLWATAITRTLIGSSVVGIAWLSIAQTDEVVVARGKLEPSGSVKDVMIPVQGVIEDIKVSEGQRVNTGDLLITLDTEVSTGRLKSHNSSLQLKLQQLDLKTQELSSTILLAEREQEMLRARIKGQSEVVKRYRSLAEQGAVGGLQLFEAELKLNDFQGQLSMSFADMQRKASIARQQIKELNSQIENLRSEIIQTQVALRYQEIRSPVSGVVLGLKPKSPGYVAQASEPVLKIVPLDSLIAQVNVPSSKIGFINVGQKADILIDSYPAVDFGVIPGIVSSVSSDASPPDSSLGQSEYLFPSRVSLNSQSLVARNGSLLPLQVGMSLSANIKLRKVSYLQLLLGAFQDKSDSLREL